MSEYFSRSEASPVDRSTARAPAAVPAVQLLAFTGSTARRDSATLTGRAAAAAAADPAVLDREAASAAEYASVHARIADILAELRSDTSSISVDGADASIQSMLPARIILVPLPPASREAVEHAVQVARKIVEQASYGHAAQAHVNRGTIDQMLSAAF